MTANRSRSTSPAGQPDSSQTRPLLNPKKPQQQASNLDKKIEYGVLIANGSSLGLIFALRQFVPLIFIGVARFILQPFNAAANLIRAVLAVYQAHKGGYTSRLVIRAAVAVVTGLGIAIALVGGLISAAAFGVVAPILSMVSFATRALYHTGCAIFYGIMGDKTAAIDNAVNAVATAFNAIAIGLVLIAMKASFGILGLASGAITAFFAMYKLYGELTAKPTADTKPKSSSDDIALTGIPSATKHLGAPVKLTRSTSGDNLANLDKPKSPSAGPRFFSPQASVLAAGPDLSAVFPVITRRRSI